MVESYKAEVSIVRSEEPLDEEKILNMVRESIDIIGGLDKIVKPGQKVLIKPNLVGPVSSPPVTNPMVTKAMVKLCKEITDDVLVGEATGATNHTRRKVDMKYVYDQTGTTKAVEEAGGTLVFTEEEGFIEVKEPDAIVARKFRIMKSVVDCDVLICLPQMHSIEDTIVSLAVKNTAMGCLDTEYKMMWHRQDLHQKICDVHRYLRPKYKLAVVDALVCSEGHTLDLPKSDADRPKIGGFGKEFPLNLIITGTDPVAVDAVGSEIMGFDPINEIHHLRLCHFYGLGCADLSKIKIKGYPLEEAKKIHGPFKPPYYYISGYFDGVDVIPGGVCESCRWWSHGLMRLLERRGTREKIVDKFGKMTFVMGVSPTIPEEPEDIDGFIVVYGDCAVNHCMQHNMNWMWAIEASRGAEMARQATAMGQAGKIKPNLRTIPMVLVSGCPPIAGAWRYRAIERFLKE